MLATWSTLMPDFPPRRPGFKDGIGLAVIELVALGAAWYFLKLDPPLVAAIGAVIVVSALAPGKWGIVASSVGMFGIAALVQFYYKFTPLAIVLAIFGLISLGGLLRRKS
jgi:hypothetical protein